MTEILILPVNAGQHEAVYPHIEHLVKKHCEASRGEFTETSVKDDLASGNSEYWIAYDRGHDRAIGLLCTQEFKDGSGRGVFIITWAVGTSNKKTAWAKPAVEALEKVARDRGHARFTTIARKGWARDELKAFRVTRWVYEKDLIA